MERIEKEKKYKKNVWKGSVDKKIVHIVWVKQSLITYNFVEMCAYVCVIVCVCIYIYIYIYICVCVYNI